MSLTVLVAGALSGAASAAPGDTAMDDAVCPQTVSAATPPGWEESLLAPGARFEPLDPASLPTGMDRRSGDYPGLCRYQAANAALKSRPRVVFFGDSITDAWIEGDPDLFGTGIIDRGISGQTSGQMLGRFEADVIALRPQVVHIMAGTNDIAGNTGPTSEETFRDNIRAMVTLARSAGIRVVIGSILPADRFWWSPQWRPARRIVEVNDWLRSFARENRIRFVDYYAVMADASGGMDRRYANDGVHPNRAGYAAMRPLAAASIQTAAGR